MTRIARTTATAALLLTAALIPLAGPAAAQSQLFEVEKSDATKLLQVQDDAGLVVRGTFQSGAIPATGAGVRLMWYPGKAAFRAGRVQGAQWDDANIGEWSVAFGQNTTASGTHSVAMNADNTASGDRSVAMGGATLASGNFSAALGRLSIAGGQSAISAGEGTEATGNFSFAAGFGAKATAERTFAVGDNTLASATWATAMGDHTTAAGTASVAMGTGVTAQGAGSFIFGDRNTGFNVAAGENSFLVRAFGGVGFNSGVNIGCDLPPGEGAWACTSSRLAKEGFVDVDGEEILGKLAGMSIQRWHYLGNAAAHVGPTAEDFRAAFGLGDSSTRIATVDADGIALRAIQALERRTAELRQENADLRRRLETLEAGIAH